MSEVSSATKDSNMIKDKGMRLHWFFSHISAIIGVLLGIANLIQMIDQYSSMPFNEYMIFDVLFVFAMIITDIVLFSNRNTFNKKEYNAAIAFALIPIFNKLYALIVAYDALLETDTYVSSFIGQLIVGVLILVYYVRRDFIFGDNSRYIYFEGKAVDPDRIPTDSLVSETESIDTEPEMRFKCDICGALSSGWYKTCPKCGAVDTMQKLEQNKTVTAEPVSNEVMFCPECGTKLEEDSIFCPECGFKIEKVKEQPTERSVPAVEKKETVNNQNEINDDVPRFCLECGTKLSADSVFCPECGTKVVTVKQQSIKTESEVKEPVKVPVKEPVKIQPVIQPEEVLFCHKCGYKLKPGSDFCSHCGAKISNN